MYFPYKDFKILTQCADVPKIFSDHFHKKALKFEVINDNYYE